MKTDAVMYGEYHAYSDVSFDMEFGPCTIYTAVNEIFYIKVYHNEERLEICYRDEEDTHLHDLHLIAAYDKYLKGNKP